jgi:prepilin-type N-terminal cleavage/methylation domain-containing protein
MVPSVQESPSSGEGVVPLLRKAGFTLIELLVAMALAGVFIAGTVTAYLQAHRQAEWSAHSLAAQSLAIQELERSRGAKWDPRATPAVDEVVSSNFPVRVEVLDVPIASTNLVYATNFVTITNISVNPGLKLIRVDCTWAFPNRGLFTNTVCTYRAPDQ